MKFGTIAAILVVSVAPVMLDMFTPWELPSSSAVLRPIIIVYFFIGPPGAFIMSILGIRFDKYKYLAVLTMLLSIAWIVVVLWLILSICTMGPW